MDCSRPDFPVLHCLAEFAQIHVYWVDDDIEPSHPLSLLLLLSIFPSITVFSNELPLHIRWPNYWSLSFSICPSNEYSELIFFGISQTPCSPRDSQESSPSQFENINSLVFSILYGPTLASIHDYWKNHSFDYMDLGWQSDVFVFLICCLGWS